ncbi:MAG: CotH kinase family protein, partial [Oscillospiraceae bacterium]|nr:CotH kinase family protein [Oscillospiraceae bacterium]
MKLKKRSILTVFLAFSMAVSLIGGDTLITKLPNVDTPLLSAEAADDDGDMNGRFRVRFRDGANFNAAKNVEAGFYEKDFELYLFATVGGIPDTSATIHYTTAGSTTTNAAVATLQTGAINANPSVGNSFVRTDSGGAIGHNALSRYDGGVRPYTWDNATNKPNGITPGVPSFPGGTGTLTVSLGQQRSAFTVSAIATRVVDGVTEYSEVITRTFVRGPSGAQATSWVDNDFLVFSLYTDAKGIFDYDEGIFNSGIDFYDYMTQVNKLGGKTYAQALSDRNSHVTQGNFPPTLPGNVTRRGRGTDYTNTGGERVAHMEIFDPSLSTEDGEAQIASQRVGIRVKGGWSRGTFVNEQKTFEIYCREILGDRDNVLWPIFGEQHTVDGNLMHRYRRFRLRMGSNDREQTYVRDEMGHDLARAGTDEMVATHRPAVVFMNGSYYGLVYVKSPRTEDQKRRQYYGGSANRVHIVDGSEMGRYPCYREGCGRVLTTSTALTSAGQAPSCSARDGSDNCGRADCSDFWSSPDKMCDWGACKGIDGSGSWAEVRYLCLGGTIQRPNTPRATGSNSSGLTGTAGSRLVEEENWKRFQELVDVDDLMFYYALQIFGANNDWPSNNFAVWRYFPTNTEKNDP